MYADLQTPLTLLATCCILLSASCTQNAHILDYNANLERHAQEAFESALAGVHARNQERLDAATAAYEEAHAYWMQVDEGAM